MDHQSAFDISISRNLGHKTKKRSSIKRLQQQHPRSGLSGFFPAGDLWRDEWYGAATGANRWISETTTNVSRVLVVSSCLSLSWSKYLIVFVCACTKYFFAHVFFRTKIWEFAQLLHPARICAVGSTSRELLEIWRANMGHLHQAKRHSSCHASCNSRHHRKPVSTM